MAVTNSLFMLACPPLFHCELARRTAPTTKEVGATHFVSVASDGGSSSRANGQYITGLRLSCQRLRGDRGWVDPPALAANQLDQALVGVRFGHGFFDNIFA